jgi:hypothetical protein
VYFEFKDKIIYIYIYILIMPKISAHEHVLTWTDGSFVDGRMYLQERETMKECIGGGLAGEPPMLKSKDCYLNSSINDKSIEVRKKSVP